MYLMTIYFLFLETITINNIFNMFGIFNHWFWLNENTIIFSLSEIGIHHICIAKIDDDLKHV